MDRNDCDLDKLNNTYSQFKTINRLLSGWKKIYRDHLRPELKKGTSYTLLDIGFGGGDVPVMLKQLADKDGFDLQITAIETDIRAVEYVERNLDGNAIAFKHCSTTDLVTKGFKFDFVISNHLIHHLDASSLTDILLEAEQLARRKVIFNDIERSDVGYVLFRMITPLLFHDSFVSYDGSISIRKSYTGEELDRSTPDRWMVKRLFPFRLLLILDLNHE